jgi:hypothetical protein
MSLLLQALQKAAKNRETGAPTPDAVGSEPPEPERVESTLPVELSVETPAEEKPSEPGLALEEEDLFEAEELAPATAAERFEPFATPSASSAQAATILRASEMQTAGWVDWVRDHPVHTFAALSGPSCRAARRFLVQTARSEHASATGTADHPAPRAPARCGHDRVCTDQSNTECSGRARRSDSCAAEPAVRRLRPDPNRPAERDRRNAAGHAAENPQNRENGIADPASRVGAPQLP